MDVRGSHKPTKLIASWSCPLCGTYLLIRKTPQHEIWTKLTLLAIDSGYTEYSGHKVRNSAQSGKIWVKKTKQNLISLCQQNRQYSKG